LTTLHLTGRPDPCRFAQQNVLISLKGLENVPQLRTLNIGNNHLSSLQGIEVCPELSTLTASANQLASLAALRPLLGCKELQTLDLQCNKIEDPAIVELVAQLPALRCLYLKGNPVVNKIKQYRKALISALPGLTYLDDRPVDEQERRCAEAWWVAA
jgi:dynein assembly factor 1